MFGTWPLARLYGFVACGGTAVSSDVLSNNTISSSGYVPSHCTTIGAKWLGRDLEGNACVAVQVLRNSLEVTDDKHDNPVRIICHTVQISKLETQSKQDCFPIDLELPFNDLISTAGWFVLKLFNFSLRRPVDGSSQPKHVAVFRRVSAKLWKATISFHQGCPSVRPSVTTRLPMDGFLWHFVFNEFSNIFREYSSFITIWHSVKYKPLWRDV